MEVIAVTFFAIAFACVVAWNVLYPRLLAKLRTHHAATWQQLGCPKYMDLRPSRTTAVLRFLLRRDYLPLADESLAVIATRARTVLIGAYVGLGIFVVLILVEIWRRG